MPQSIGVPVKLLHESEGHKVSIELVNGEVYRGLMMDAEDNMNCQLQAGLYFFELSKSNVFLVNAQLPWLHAMEKCPS